MPDIVLTTLNAKYIHTAFGLRYLLANLGVLRERASLLEFDISQRPVDIAEALLARRPRIIGFGVYVWNVMPTTEVVAAIKRLRPEMTIILGGPEVSFEVEGLAVVELADYVIAGEADLEFGRVCGQVLVGAPDLAKFVTAEPPDLSRVTLPYDWYDERDIAHRVIYVEASRGCPFSCEFCLSALAAPVRQVPLTALFEHLDRLLQRGARHLKFVDRTFNLDLEVSRAILEFLLTRYQPGHLFHFEVVPDRLPTVLRDIIVKFPAGALQFEVGVQTFNPEVAARIHRHQNYDWLEENLRFLRRETGVHLHADLVVGLPGESLESLAAGFDRLVGLGPQEIQVGILKRLRGAPIARHDQEWQMVYNPYPPYEILQHLLLDFAAVQQLRRFARFWDLISNSGNFVETTPLIWSEMTPFDGFLRCSEWLFGRVGRTASIALVRLMALLFDFLTEQVHLERELVAAVLWRDYQRGGRRDKPDFLREFLPANEAGIAKPSAASLLPRQARFESLRIGVQRQGPAEAGPWC
jgi:radical SAM superfamily enzyme YgiQ (UPF0313 family)